MADGHNKYQSRENRAKVRQVLMEAWDPLGVCGVPEARDEYDAYVDKLYVMIMDKPSSHQAIAAYLYDIATIHMGLSAWPELGPSCNHAASLIAGLRSSFQTH